MIETSRPMLAAPSAILLPKPVKVTPSAVEKFARDDQEMQYNDLINLESLPSGLPIATGQRPSRELSRELRFQWADLRKAFTDKFADDLTPDPESTNVALEQKKADLKTAMKTLDASGLIGRYFAGYCGNVDDGLDGAQRQAAKVLQAFNRFFGACLSCNVPEQRIDALLAAFTIGEDELFTADGANELCTNGMQERLEFIVQRKLKPSSMLVVQARFYSTAERFAARHNINTGANGVHAVSDLVRIRPGQTDDPRQQLQQRLMKEAAQDLAPELDNLLQEKVPALLSDLYRAFSQTEPPLPKELEALEEKHPFAWNALFPAGTSAAKLLQDQNQKYVVWNDMKTEITDIKWDDLLVGFLQKMKPFLGTEALLHILDANAWAAPLKDELEQDPYALARLAFVSADSYRVITKLYPDIIFVLHQYRDPGTGYTCLHALARNGELASLVRKGEVDLHLLLGYKVNGSTPFDILLRQRDRPAIEAVVLQCMHHEESASLQDKMLRAMRSAVNNASGAVFDTLPALLGRYGSVLGNPQSIAHFRDIGDPEKASWLLMLASEMHQNYGIFRHYHFDRLNVAQLDMLVRILANAPTGTAHDRRARSRAQDIMLVQMERNMLQEFTPEQIAEIVNIARLDSEAYNMVDANTGKLRTVRPEGLAALGRLLQIDRATTRSGEKFLFKHFDAFLKLGEQAQIDTAAMFARHRPFIKRHAREWFGLDQEQMRSTLRALDLGLIGNLGNVRIDPRWKLANPLIDPQKKWFKLSGAQMASMTASYGNDARADQLVAKRFPQLRKLGADQIRQTIESFTPTP